LLMNLKNLLEVANKKYFAVPAFNISDYSMFNGIFEAVEEKQSPVIIAIHPNELAHIRVEMITSIIQKINKSRIPASIHLDHGSSLKEIVTAIQSGFTSVMIDGSNLPIEENIDLTKKVVEIAHYVNISVEGELGTIGSTDTESETKINEIIYTNPDDAVYFVKKTGIDALAIAIGTSHGLYPKGVKPKLKLEILKKIKENLPIPLVLHGGSNNPDSEISEAVRLGINKINISSDIKKAYFEKMREILKDQNLREPNVIQPPCIDYMKKVAIQKIELFQAAGKAKFY